MSAISTQFDKLVLIDRQNETPDTVSFYFHTSNQQPLDFKPGQFINIGLSIDQVDYYRSYSISSLPQENKIQLTIKRVPNGIVSNWLIDQLNIGDTIQVHGIAGHFNIIDTNNLNKHLIFISAGCGITPIMSMVRYLLQHQQERIQKISFIHCARDENNLIYETQINELAEKHSQFTPTFYIDQFVDANKCSLTRQQGPLDCQKLEQHLLEIAKEDSYIFLCGPTAFMEMIQNHLVQLDFNMDNFDHESFTPDTTFTNPHALNTQHVHTVSVPDFGVDIDAQEGETLLAVLEKGELPIIAACRSGICGSCKCQVIEGEVETHHKSVEQGLLTEDEVRQGYTLACSSTIKGTVTIKL